MKVHWLIPIVLILGCNTPKPANEPESERTTFTREDILAIESESVAPSGTDTFHYFTLPDTHYQQYQLPVAFEKPANWQRADSLNREYNFYGNDYPKEWELNDALTCLDTATTLWYLGSAKSWCIDQLQ